eukprot:Awhi_evm1s13394
MNTSFYCVLVTAFLLVDTSTFAANTDVGTVIVKDFNVLGLPNYSPTFSVNKYVSSPNPLNTGSSEYDCGMISIDFENLKNETSALTALPNELFVTVKSERGPMVVPLGAFSFKPGQGVLKQSLNPAFSQTTITIPPVNTLVASGKKLEMNVELCDLSFSSGGNVTVE